MTNFITRFNNNNAFLEILGDPEDLNDYFVEFVDLNNNFVEYTTSIKVNHWTQISNILDKNILIKVISNNKLVFERERNYKFNKVFILFGSESLGDTVGWMPYVEEYRKVNNVEVVLYTRHNHLFDNVYPNIIFTNISDSNLINDVDKKFRIDYGPELYRINNVIDSDKWSENNKKYDNFVDYFDYRKISLQSIAALILGLPTDEIKPEINIPDHDGSKIKGKYVVVAIQSTAQLKYWNNPFGWERLFDFLGRNGYKIVLIDRFKNFGVSNHFNKAPKSKYVIDKTGNFPLSERIIDIKYADMMITISSGLAWVSWAIGTPVVMISGFTKPINEFKTNIIRIHNSNVCNGCWNDPNLTFDSSDWMFCPRKMGFICSKAILPKDVIDAVKKFMK